jgi:hypothetical protein
MIVMATFGRLYAAGRRSARRSGRGGSQAPDGFKQAFAVTEGDAELLEIALGQLGQHLVVDLVLSDDRLAFLETEASQPNSDIHGRVLTKLDS